MQIEQLKIKKSANQYKRLEKAYSMFQNLLIALDKKGISTDVLGVINVDIRLLNSFLGTDKEKAKALRKTYAKILKLIEKELKLVTKNHYRNLWMALGMAFGVPFGTVFSSILNNYAFIGIGIPIGMAIGIAYGTTLDKNAEKEGRQLELVCDLEVF